MPNFRGVRFTNAHETLIWAVKSKHARATFNYQSMKAINDGLQMRSDWNLPICSGPERVRVNGQKAHSTQKPAALLYRVILASSHPGDVVLDPFFGSGTTGAVARLLGRRWIGIERDEKYIAVAQERIAQVVPAPPEALDLPRRSRKKRDSRLRFPALVEAGLLLPGQKLFFKGDRAQPALILANGHLRLADFTGSIHQTAHHLSGAPGNGWECWSVEDASGSLVSIDEVRRQLSQSLADGKNSLPLFDMP
jgi:modification methylase